MPRSQRHQGHSRFTSAISSLLRRTSVLAAITAIAAVALSLGAASSANAMRVIKCSGYPSTCVTVCRQQLANGSSVDYSEGTEITVNLTDGTSRKFTCKNGSWVPSRTDILLGDIVHAVAVAGLKFTVDVGCPDAVRSCAPGTTIWAPAL
jgi:hypothetical protein